MEEVHDSQTLGRRVNEIVLLWALGRTPMHGYQAALEIERRSGGYFRFNHGTLYPILHRLEKEGLIAGEWSDPEEGRPRKEYVLTEAGRTYLAEISESWQALVERMDPFLGTGDGHESVRTGAA